MKLLRPFELSLVIGFAILGVSAVALLALYKPAPDPNVAAIAGPVSIWGTLPEQPVRDILAELARETPAYAQVTYRYVDPRNFSSAFITALADQTGPDLVLMPHTELVAQRNRLQPLSYEVFSQRDFRNRYIDGAEIFALRDGVYALPIALDPLVLYWNRDIVINAGFFNAPATWEQFVGEMVPRLTQREFDLTIRRAGAALGEFVNIQHVHPILSMLAVQAGSRFVVEGDRGYEIRLNEGVQGTNEPFTQALEFYMRFSNPQNQLYTWNRALPLDRDMFVREELSLYFGFGSEARNLAARNPNLNFDIAEVPQGAAASVRRTYAQFYGLALVRNSRNVQGAYTVLNALASEQYATRLAQEFFMAPASRFGLAAGSPDVYGSIVYSSAPIARAWLSPAPSEMQNILETSIRAAVAERTNIRGVANDAATRLRLAY